MYSAEASNRSSCNTLCCSSVHGKKVVLSLGTSGTGRGWWKMFTWEPLCWKDNLFKALLEAASAMQLQQNSCDGVQKRALPMAQRAFVLYSTEGETVLYSALQRQGEDEQQPVLLLPVYSASRWGISPCCRYSVVQYSKVHGEALLATVPRRSRGAGSGVGLSSQPVGLLRGPKEGQEQLPSASPCSRRAELVSSSCVLTCEKAGAKSWCLLKPAPPPNRSQEACASLRPHPRCSVHC